MTNLCLIILLLLHTVPAALSKKTARTSSSSTRNLQNSISSKANHNYRNVRHRQQPKEEQKILSEIFDDLTHDIHLELNKTRTGWDENVRRKRLQIHLTGENGLKSPLAEMLAAQQQAAAAEKAAAATADQAEAAERSSLVKATEPDVKALEAASEQVVLLEQPDDDDDQLPVAAALTDEMGMAETQMHEMVKSVPEAGEFRSSSDVFEDSEIADSHISEMRRLPKSNPGLGITHIAHGELGAYHYKILDANAPPSLEPGPGPGPGPGPRPGPSPYDKYTTPAPHVSSLAPKYHSYPVTPAPPPGYFSTYGPHHNGPPVSPYDPYGPPPVHHDPYGPPPLHHDPYGPPPHVPHHGPYHPPPLVTTPKPVYIGTYGMFLKKILYLNTKIGIGFLHSAGIAD